MKNIQVITFDFWGTLYHSSGSNNFNRVKVLKNALQEAGLAHITDEALDEAIKTTWKEWVRVWEQEHRTWGASEWMQHMKAVLDFRLPAGIEERVLQELEDVLLDGNTQPLGGVLEMIPALAQEYKLGIISDTGVSSGKTLSKLLARDGLLPYFSCLIYSDEVQSSKPAARPFQAALECLQADPAQGVHVGDLRRTDISGARSAGMYSIRYTGHQDDARVEFGEADVVLADYAEMPAALEQIEALAQNRSR